jgi:hypothetical protein
MKLIRCEDLVNAYLANTARDTLNIMIVMIQSQDCDSPIIPQFARLPLYTGHTEDYDCHDLITQLRFPDYSAVSSHAPAHGTHSYVVVAVVSLRGCDDWLEPLALTDLVGCVPFNTGQLRCMIVLTMPGHDCVDYAWT